MKILFVCHEFSNYGGILSHTEQLMAGFNDLGHTTKLICLKPSKKALTSTKSSGKMDEFNSDIGAGSGLMVHQGKGWYTQYQPFLNSMYVDSFIKMANEYDIVIWESIFGFKNADTEGQTDWIRMIKDVKSKQIIIVHDGNLKKFYPWVNHVKNHITGLACVHPSAYKSTDQIEIPARLILNPQNDVVKTSATRKRQILSLQTFKRWKRVDNLVAAIPHIKDIDVIIAGDGIERAYMSSPDKCKPEYFCTPGSDSHATKGMYGKKIWDNALNSGMKYLGFISEKQRDEILSESKFLIDTSWSKSYGSHFNRVIVDAMRVGVVPIARNLGVSDNELGLSDFFKPNDNYLMIPWNATPKEFADYINEFMDMPQDQYDKIVENNYNLVNCAFNRKKIANDYIELSNGEGARTGKLTDKTVMETIDDLWCNHFKFEERLIQRASLDSFF